MSMHTLWSSLLYNYRDSCFYASASHGRTRRLKTMNSVSARRWHKEGQTLHYNQDWFDGYPVQFWSHFTSNSTGLWRISFAANATCIRSFTAECLSWLKRWRLSHWFCWHVHDSHNEVESEPPYRQIYCLVESSHTSMLFAIRLGL